MTITREEYYRLNGNVPRSQPRPESFREFLLAKEAGSTDLGYQGIRIRKGRMVRQSLRH